MPQGKRIAEKLIIEAGNLLVAGAAKDLAEASAAIGMQKSGLSERLARAGYTYQGRGRWAGPRFVSHAELAAEIAASKAPSGPESGEPVPNEAELPGELVTPFRALLSEAEQALGPLEPARLGEADLALLEVDLLAPDAFADWDRKYRAGHVMPVQEYAPEGEADELAEINALLAEAAARVEKANESLRQGAALMAGFEDLKSKLSNAEATNVRLGERFITDERRLAGLEQEVVELGERLERRERRVVELTAQQAESPALKQAQEDARKLAAKCSALEAKIAELEPLAELGREARKQARRIALEASKGRLRQLLNNGPQ